jgi:DNA-binding transcriptional MerR regulator
LRYYQELGLIDPADHRPGNNRRYSDTDVARLTRIIELRDVMGFDLDRIREILHAEDRLAQLREEARTDVTVERRQDIIREASVINRHLRRQVLEKMDVLHGFLSELDDREAHIQDVAEEWGVDLDASSHREGASAALAVTAAHQR